MNGNGTNGQHILFLFAKFKRISPPPTRTTTRTNYKQKVATESHRYQKPIRADQHCTATIEKLPHHIIQTPESMFSEKENKAHKIKENTNNNEKTR